MKRVAIAITVAAMLFSFTQILNADDSATLGLAVSFDLGTPLTIHTSASGQVYVLEAEDPISFEVYAEGEVGREIIIDMPGGPEGSYFERDPFPVPSGTVVGRFHWTASMEQIRLEYYIAVFHAFYADDPDSVVDVVVELQVVHPALKIGIKPEGDFEVTEGKTLEFTVWAISDDVNLILEGVLMPDGAVLHPDAYPGPANDRTRRFEWTPKPGQAQEIPYEAIFKAWKEDDPYRIEKVSVKIAVFIDPDVRRINEISGALDDIALTSEEIYLGARDSWDIDILSAAANELSTFAGGDLDRFKYELDKILAMRPDLTELILGVLDKLEDIRGVLLGYIGYLGDKAESIYANQWANETFTKSRLIFEDALASGDPQVVADAINALGQMLGQANEWIIQLDEIAQRTPDLQGYIYEEVIPICKELAITLEGYIDRLKGIVITMQIWVEPNPGGPFEIEEGEELRFYVIAQDQGIADIELVQDGLPLGAEFQIVEGPILTPEGLRIKGEFVWTPQPGQAQTDYHYAVFNARGTGQNGWVGIGVPILVRPASAMLKIWTEPEGPFVAIEGELLTFNVRGGDEAGNPACLTAIELPPGASFSTSDWFSKGVFEWTPDSGQAQNEPYKAIIKGWLDIDHDGSIDPEEPTATLVVEVFVKQAPTIAIELVDVNGQPLSNWEHDGAKFNSKILNKLSDAYRPEAIHRVKSNSNIDIGVRIGVAEWSGYEMGQEPGDGIFALMLCADGYPGGTDFLPNEMKVLVENLGPDKTKQIPLALFTPRTGDPEKGLKVMLRIDAYPSVAQ